METFVIKFVFRLLTVKDFVCFGEASVKKGEHYVENGLLGRLRRKIVCYESLHV